MNQTFGPDQTDPSNAIFMPREAGPGRMWPRDLPGHESGAADRACGGGWRVPRILGKPGPSGRSVAAADGRRGAEPRCWRIAGLSACGARDLLSRQRGDARAAQRRFSACSQSTRSSDVAGGPGVAAPGGKQQRVEVSLGRLLVVHLKSVVVPGKRFCCDAEQHSPPASVRVADQPRADDDATSLSTPVNCPLG
jgi:hypothetical protein